MEADEILNLPTAWISLFTFEIPFYLRPTWIPYNASIFIGDQDFGAFAFSAQEPFGAIVRQELFGGYQEPKDRIAGRGGGSVVTCHHFYSHGMNPISRNNEICRVAGCVVENNSA